VDITIEVMLPERGATDFDGPGNAGYGNLDIVAVYDHPKVIDTVGMPRTGYVRVTGVPDQHFEKIKALLLQTYDVAIGAEAPVYFKKRRWTGLSSRMSAALRNRLLNNRQIGENGALTWDAFKAFLRNTEQGRDFSDEDVAANGDRPTLR
jgi:hypothetical protein